jgi:hypothetical protein
MTERQPIEATKRRSVWFGVGISVLGAAAYGIFTYFTFDEFGALPSLGFACLVPVAMGAATLLFSDPDQLNLYVRIVFGPWMAVIVSLLGLFAIAREGALCLVILLAPFLALALVGSLIGWLIAALVVRSRKKRRAAGIVSVLLPFAFLPVDHLLQEEEVVQVRTTTTIHASAEDVWSRLANFDTITSEELPSSTFDLLDVPRPIRARAEHDGVGARRVGEFEHDLAFDEVIIETDAPHALAFSVDVDPTDLRPGSAERHAFEGGYFRFVDARYLITEQPDGTLEVSLTSRYHLRTSINAYGKLWANALISDFQSRVLHVLRKRAEAHASSAPHIAERHP